MNSVLFVNATIGFSENLILVTRVNPYFLENVLNSMALNCGPLSDYHSSGIPKWFFSLVMTACAVVLVRPFTLNLLENESTNTKYLDPF